MTSTAITPKQAQNMLTAMPDPEAVRRFERIGLQLPQMQLECTHVIHGGMCARTIFIPAGTVLTGAQLDVDTVCVVVGDITVTTDDGVRRLQGHHVLPAFRDNKRVGITHADTYWTMLFKADGRTVEEIEREMTSEFERMQTRRKAERFQNNDFVRESQFDFDRFAIEYALPPELLQGIMDHTDDLTVTEECLSKVEIGQSLIHGRGLFAISSIKAGEFICVGSVDGKRAIGGRFTNHSPFPNAEYRLNEKKTGIDVYAKRNIEPDEEILLDYREAFEVNPVLEDLRCQQQ